MGTSSVAPESRAPGRRIPIAVDESMVGACPGWYYDPHDEAIYRWFDGENWTDDLCDIISSDSPVDGGTEHAN